MGGKSCAAGPVLPGAGFGGTLFCVNAHRGAPAAGRKGPGVAPGCRGVTTPGDKEIFCNDSKRIDEKNTAVYLFEIIYDL